MYQVVGQLGMWGALINGIQAAGLEHVAMTHASWNGATSMSSASLPVPVSQRGSFFSWFIGSVHRSHVYSILRRSTPLSDVFLRLL